MLEITYKKMSETYARIFERMGLKFREVPAQAWHPEVRLFEVSDEKTRNRIGWFYLDIFRRPSKGGAYAVPLVSGRATKENGYLEPVSALMADFDRPPPGKQSLLNLEEVQTFLHEFGHVMHFTLSRDPTPQPNLCPSC